MPVNTVVVFTLDNDFLLKSVLGRSVVLCCTNDFLQVCIKSQPRNVVFVRKKKKVNADMYKEKWCKCPGRKKEAIALKGENVGGAPDSGLATQYT